MKKIFNLKNFIILILLLLIAGGSIYWNVKRFSVNEPMMDIEYKKAILNNSKNPFYTLERLRPLMGEEELTKFIKENNDNESIYTPTRENRYSGIFQANLHNHTTNSDGSVSVKRLLDKAQKYAKYFINDGYMVIGITDHNTVLGAKDIIKVLQKYPNRYPNLKIVAGMEIHSAYDNSKISPGEPVQIHVLAWCINPYDKYLNKEFYKKNKKDRINRGLQDRDFDTLIKTMSDYSIVGIAHPARYLPNIQISDRPLYIEEMFDRYLKQTKKVPFVEGYYQSYSSKEIREFEGIKELSKDEYTKVLEDGTIEILYGKKFDAFKNEINAIADKKGIIKTGSTDSHGDTIFRHK